MGMAATIPYYTVDELERFKPDGNRYELLDRVLLVTPPPSVSHELVVSRIVSLLLNAVQTPGHGFVFTHGAVSFPPKTQLEPDILVLPPAMPASDKWQDVGEHWLAVEVLSRSSHIYDREFKRDAYLALGVHEVWLVDRAERCVEIARHLGAGETVRDTIIWLAPTIGLEVEVDVPALFLGID